MNSSTYLKNSIFFYYHYDVVDWLITVSIDHTARFNCDFVRARGQIRIAHPHCPHKKTEAKGEYTTQTDHDHRSFLILPPPLARGGQRKVLPHTTQMATGSES